MNKRVLSIDVLRAIAILGMVFCASIGWNSNLPAWMFHAQVPPPDYIFNPDVPGITWVDLVFPFFIFSMGAALPFSMDKRLSRGTGISRIVLDLFHRWFSLTLFAILLGNVAVAASSDKSPTALYLFRMFIWFSFFMMFVRLGSVRKSIAVSVKCGGAFLLTFAMFVESRYFGVELSLYHSDIIILILANLVLCGGLIWLFTKRAPLFRIGICLVVVLLKGLDYHCPQALGWVPSVEGIDWLFRWRFLQYMIVIIPATLVGDRILKYMSGKSGNGIEKQDRRSVMAVALIPCMVVFQLWALFSRHVWLDVFVCVGCIVLFVILTGNRMRLWNGVALSGFLFLTIGVVMDPVDGGIAKDPCNLSFMFTTCGIAMMVVAFLLFFELVVGRKCGFLAKVGQNPMIAYTLSGYVVSPLLYLSGILGPFDQMTVGSQFWGLMRGVLITGLTLLVTYGFSRFRVYWRS